MHVEPLQSENISIPDKKTSRCGSSYVGDDIIKGSKSIGDGLSLALTQDKKEADSE